tara:strand:+ start:142 stop:1152 length:1011 start_codon:yes stop_codon:yes gene_type:complete
MLNKILIYNSGGGLGDSIHLFPLILSLKKHFRASEIYYLSAHENHFENKLRDYGVEIKALNLGFKYFGFRWWHYFAVSKKFDSLGLGKFDLVIDLQSKIRNTLILKKIPSKKFYSPTFNHFFCSNSKDLKNIKKNSKSNNIRSIMINIKKFLGIELEYVEYTLENIQKNFHNEALKLLPNKNYVGFSLTQGNVYRKKEWALKNVVKLCKILKLKKKIPVFFIEKKNKLLKNEIIQLIPDSIFPEHESDLASPALVSCLGKRLDFAISIDNGVMHMLSLGKVPIVVLFGPTKSEKFAPDYNDVIIIDSKKLKKTSDISSINAEDVLQAIEQNPNFSY